MEEALQSLKSKVSPILVGLNRIAWMSLRMGNSLEVKKAMETWTELYISDTPERQRQSIDRYLDGDKTGAEVKHKKGMSPGRRETFERRSRREIYDDSRR